MAVSPTGFGKSSIFQLAPFIIGLKRGHSADNIDCCTLVILLLNSIMIDQCQSKREGKDQESIQSSTTPDTGYQWESNKLTIRHHKREPRGMTFPSR